MKKANEMDAIERLKAPTPEFFKKVRTLGILVGIVGGTLAATPVALPVALISLSGYLITAGSIMTTIASFAVEDGDVKP